MREFLKNIVGAAAAVTIGLRLSYSMPELAVSHPFGSGWWPMQYEWVDYRMAYSITK